jgi:hypothetical protein
VGVDAVAKNFEKVAVLLECKVLNRNRSPSGLGDLTLHLPCIYSIRNHFASCREWEYEMVG